MSRKNKIGFLSYIRVVPKDEELSSAKLTSFIFSFITILSVIFALVFFDSHYMPGFWVFFSLVIVFGYLTYYCIAMVIAINKKRKKKIHI